MTNKLRKALCKINIHQWDEWIEFRWANRKSFIDRECKYCGLWHVKNTKTLQEQFVSDKDLMKQDFKIII